MKAIVLLSGGLDSCVVLAHALSIGRTCHAISFHYGQRHLCELQSAKKIASHYGVRHQTIHLDPSIFSDTPHASLTDPNVAVEQSIDALRPNTYVPCRNILFLAHAAALAESVNATEIFFGANANDGPSYPDCRPSFFQSFEQTVAHGSRIGKLAIVCPLIDLQKKAIVTLGKNLNAPLDLTWSCYDPQENKPCSVCAACLLRSKAFS